MVVYTHHLNDSIAANSEATYGIAAGSFPGEPTDAGVVAFMATPLTDGSSVEVIHQDKERLPVELAPPQPVGGGHVQHHHKIHPYLIRYNVTVKNRSNQVVEFSLDSMSMSE